MCNDLLRFRPRFGKTACWHLHAGFVHSFLEKQAIFRNANGLAFRANHFYATLLEHARQIERGLPANSWQQGIRAFLPDDGADGFNSERLDVGDVSRFRVGHDGCWIGIDQYDCVTFLTQSFACLRTGIVKLASLSNDNWA